MQQLNAWDILRNRTLLLTRAGLEHPFTREERPIVFDHEADLADEAVEAATAVGPEWPVTLVAASQVEVVGVVGV